MELMSEEYMKNRYGNEYNFEKVSENVYTIVGELSYWRYGGREGQPEMDFNDLGFVDPSGGPFISLGYAIEGRKITRIRAEGENIYFDVE
jgi:hypothetical protein